MCSKKSITQYFVPHLNFLVEGGKFRTIRLAPAGQPFQRLAAAQFLPMSLPWNRSCPTWFRELEDGRSMALTIRTALALFILGPLASPAGAINWDGHEDWLEESPHALEFERHLDGRAAPLPETRAVPKCQKRDDVGAVPANPYEPAPMLCVEERHPGK